IMQHPPGPDIFPSTTLFRSLSMAFHAVRSGASVDDAVFASGYDSYSGFRSAFSRAFGTNPGNGSGAACVHVTWMSTPLGPMVARSEEHTSELQSRENLVCRL